MPGRGRKPGSVARSVFVPGDRDAAGASASDRFNLIDDVETMTVANAHGGAVVRLGVINEKIRRCHDILAARGDARRRRLALVEDRLASAQAWRAVRIQERYSTELISARTRRGIYVGFAAVDFFIVAQAYAFVTDVPDLSLQWWLGGLLGVMVFAAGLILARQVKTLIVAQRQVAHLHNNGRQVGLPLIPLDPARPVLVGSGTVFGVLTTAGLLMRIEGGDDRLGVLILTASIPILITVVEIYLYDPLDREGPSENWVDRLIRARKMRLEHRHERMLGGFEYYLNRVSASFDYERHVAWIIAADLGMPCPRYPNRADTDLRETTPFSATIANGHRRDDAVAEQ